MANVPVVGRSFKIDGANRYILGKASKGLVSMWLIQIINDNTLAGHTITIMQRVEGGVFVPIPYRKRYLTSLVGDDSVVNVAVALDALIKVDASGGEIAIDVTGSITGSATVYCEPIENGSGS
jgi:hypothetical protein